MNNITNVNTNIPNKYYSQKAHQSNYSSDINCTMPFGYAAQNNCASITDYKASIYKKIDNMVKKSTDHEDMVWVNLSDECFENMRQNPEYEAWVLDKIQKACNSCKSNNGYAKWTVLNFGASETDFKEVSHSFPDKKTREKEREEEREAREALRKKRKKLLEKKLLEAKLRKQKIERNYTQLKIIDHQKQIQEENKALLFGQNYYPRDHSASLYATAKRRASAYEATFIFYDNP